VAQPLLIDCDPGHDDAIALLLALASPELDLRGITTVAGNQTVDLTTHNALAVLTLAGRDDVPVARGASAPLSRALRAAPEVHGQTGLDGAGGLLVPSTAPVADDAVSFLVARLARGATLVATGPLTNVAAVLEAGTRPERLVWMGGGVHDGDITDVAEFNAFVDPEAAAAVFASDVTPVMVGLDVTHRALVEALHVERLRAAGRTGRFVAGLLDYYGGVYRARNGWTGTPVHDALAVAVALDPTLVHTEHLHVRIHTHGSECGRTEIVPDAPPNAHVALRVDTTRFLELLCSRLESLP
jgi:pyrimidine-specific ribonucleoside hydrolase